MLSAPNTYILLLLTSLISLRTVLILASAYRFLKKPPGGDPEYYKKIFISIIVPVHYLERNIANNIQRLIGIDRDLKKEVILVVDGPEEEISEQVAFLIQGYNNLKIISIEKSGKPSALNRGIEEAKGDIIILTDIDDRWQEGSLKNLVRHFHDPELAGISGQVIPASKEGHLNSCQLVEYMTFYIDRLAASLWQGVTIPGGIGAFRKEVFDRIGCFRMGIEAEDLDNSLNILGKGYRTICEPEALVYTQGTPDSLWGLIKQRVRWYVGIAEVFNRRLKDIVFKRLDLKSKLRLLWHLFNLQIYHYIIMVGIVWFLIYSITSRNWVLFFIWEGAITLNLLLYFVLGKIILKKKAVSPRLKHILFFMVIYFYFLLLIRFFSQLLAFLGKEIKWSRGYILKTVDKNCLKPNV